MAINFNSNNLINRHIDNGNTHQLDTVPPSGKSEISESRSPADTIVQGSQTTAPQQNTATGLKNAAARFGSVSSQKAEYVEPSMDELWNNDQLDAFAGFFMALTDATQMTDGVHENLEVSAHSQSNEDVGSAVLAAVGQGAIMGLNTDTAQDVVLAFLKGASKIS